MSQAKPKIVALSGGVGRAKLALCLEGALDADELAIIANTGDDLEHIGCRKCPDIDTLVYSLRIDDPDEAWFALGDKDLETHQYRTKAMQDGKSLTETTTILVVSSSARRIRS